LPEPRVRRARPDDAERVARLLYESSAALYDRYAGGPDAALRVLRAAFGRPGTTASAEVVTVAELDGRPAGAMAAFPVREAARRGRAFLGVTLRRIPPWRWPQALGLYRVGARTAPAPPPAALYVDALATEPPLRRRGAARALLAAADEQARDAGCRSLALDTAASNGAAQALYEGAGFRVAARRPPAGDLPGFVAFVKELRD
jgi:ribosomal protein S18 acetylase RimI-like enzyme